MIITVILAVLAGFIIPALIEMKVAAAQARRFLMNTEESLNNALNEVEETSRSIRSITDNIHSVTENISSVSSSVSELAEHIEGTVHSVQKLTSLTAGSVLGLKAGIMAAFGVLLDNLFFKRGGDK